MNQHTHYDLDDSSDSSDDGFLDRDEIYDILNFQELILIDSTRISCSNEGINSNISTSIDRTNHPQPESSSNSHSVLNQNNQAETNSDNRNINQLIHTSENADSAGNQYQPLQFSSISSSFSETPLNEQNTAHSSKITLDSQSIVASEPPQEAGTSVVKEDASSTNLNSLPAANNLSNSQVFKCNVCNKTYKKEIDLHLHEALHHIESKDYICCGFRFRHLKPFSEHQLQYHTPPSMLPFRCCFCETRFKLLKDVVIHKTRKHAQCWICRPLCVICRQNLKQQYLHSRKHLLILKGIQQK